MKVSKYIVTRVIRVENKKGLFIECTIDESNEITINYNNSKNIVEHIGCLSYNTFEDISSQDEYNNKLIKRFIIECIKAC